MSVQKLISKLHLYVGLWLGFLVIIVGLTGTALVYFYPIDRLLNPSLLSVEPSDRQVPLESIIAAARAHRENLTGPTRVQIPPRADMPHILAFEDAEGEWIEVMVDPGNGAVLGSRRAEDALIWQIFLLHTELLAGERGFLVVALTGGAALIASLSGLYLWWPRAGRWRHALRFKASRNARRTIYDLHRIGGAYFSLIIIMLSFTGLYIMYPDIFGAPLRAVAAAPAEQPPTAAPASCARRTTADQAAALARGRFPDARLTTLYPSSDNADPHEIAVWRPGEWRYPYGATRVYVAADCPQVVRVDDARAAPLETAVRNAMLPWHSGQAFGPFGQVLVFLSGLGLTGLVVAGFLIWWQKRPERRRRRARASARLQAGEAR